MKKQGIGEMLLRYAGRIVLWVVVLAVASVAAPLVGLKVGTGVPVACALGALGVPGFAALLIVHTMFG